MPETAVVRVHDLLPLPPIQAIASYMYTTSRKRLRTCATAVSGTIVLYAKVYNILVSETVLYLC